MIAHKTWQAGCTLRIRGELWRLDALSRLPTCPLVHVTGVDSANRGQVACFLAPFERMAPIEVSTRPRFVSRARLRRALRAVLLGTPPLWSSLRMRSSPRLDVLPFQLEPALALTTGLTTRVLLADAVGLGKTIQAGIVLADTRARLPLARILVVTPASLREQWRDELRDRFDIHADIVESSWLLQAQRLLPPDANPWLTSVTAVTSIDFLKRPEIVRALEGVVWDVVVFDEAHTLARRSDRRTVAELIAARARTLLLLTATPHSGDDASLGALAKLGDLHGDNAPMLLFRRGRHDVGLSDAHRTHLHTVLLTSQERRMHDALASYRRRLRQEAVRRGAPGLRLLTGMLTKRACSSPWALARSIARRRMLLEQGPEPGEVQRPLPWDDSPDDADQCLELGVPGFADVHAEQSWLAHLYALAMQAIEGESKVARLLRLLHRLGEPAIVFTEYRDTLGHLAAALEREDVVQLHGGMLTSERRQQLRAFTHGTARILLATDAASEGVNLHHRCRLIVNLEVPWTVLRAEQRLGRVHRLGQRRRTHDFTFVAGGTLEHRLAAQLVTRRHRIDATVPFAPAARALSHEGRPGPLSDAAALCDEARHDARRLFHQQAGPRPQARTPAGRPLAGLLTRHRHHVQVHCVWRLTFLDTDRLPLWTSLVSVRADTIRPEDTTSIEWLTGLPARDAPQLAAALHACATAQRTNVERDIVRAIRRALDRERAIAAGIRATDARLAASLLQPGLFDARTDRRRAAHDVLSAQALSATAERLIYLESLQHPILGEPHLLFVACAS